MITQREKRPQVCFVGPLPPPTHGMANVNAEILRILRDRAEVVSYAVMPAPNTGGVRYHATKAARLIVAMVGVFRSRLHGCRTYYGSVDDGWGALGTIAVAAAARLCRYRIFLHHHSYRYIERKSSLMRALTYVAGARACHVLLCGDMDERFRKAYPGVYRTAVVPNTAPDVPHKSIGQPTGAFKIGMLSNLMFEKGVREFTDLLEAAHGVGMNIAAVLAGPAWNGEVETYIADAVARNEGRLTWLGPILGSDKDRFFASIDAFVFPTRYAAECYPLVILEALAHGTPVISTDRGCIGCLSSYASIEVIPRHADFVAAAMPLISHLANKPRHALRSSARSDGELLGRSAREACRSLIEAILRADGPMLQS